MELHTIINGFLIASSLAVAILGYLSRRLDELKPLHPATILTYLLLLASTIYVTICAILVSAIPCYLFKDSVKHSIKSITHISTNDEFESQLMYLKVPATILISNYIFIFLVIAFLEYRTYQRHTSDAVQQSNPPTP